MSITPPDAPPYPSTPEDDRPDEETSAAAYAEILVCSFLMRFCLCDCDLFLVISMVFWIQ